jgi:hypothetical protein
MAKIMVALLVLGKPLVLGKLQMFAKLQDESQK